MSNDYQDEMPGTAESSSGPGSSDIRSSRRAQRAAERAARAQRKADSARERAVDAARAGGLFEGMDAMPRTDAAPTGRQGAQRPPYGAGDAGKPQPRPYGESTGTESPAPPSWLVPVLAAAAVIFVVLAGLATWGYIEARDDTAVEQAIAAAPQDAANAARDITTQMFSYDHQTVDADLAAVREQLTEPALSEFVETSMPAVASAAKQQEATVFATVAAAATENVVDQNHVTVLVMLNRMVSTKDEPKAASSASRLLVDMVRGDDGQWKLGKLSSL